METITFLDGLTFTIPATLSKRNRTLAIKDAASCIKEFLLGGYSAIDIAESEVFKSTIQTIINSYLCYKN